jgi:peptide/nickel transport system substrate-binding protein
MKRGIAGVVLAGLISLLFIVSSCAAQAPVTSSQAPTKSIAPTTNAPPVTATTVPAAETPKYGGVLVIAQGGDITNFDEVYGWHVGAWTMHLTNEELWTGDWVQGPAGTNKTNWAIPALDRWDQKAGMIAETWDFSRLSEGIMTFHIRKGVRWALNPNSEASKLVNGRELTADDVVSTLKMYITNPRAYLYTGAPSLRNASITAADKYTVVIKVDPTAIEEAIGRFCDFASIVPPEVVTKYGDMTNWRNSVGSGPFMLTDFVSGTAATLVKNPQYWGKDPVGTGKGNQLPYLDGVKLLIVPDASTRDAAIRTGKVDISRGVNKETASNLVQSAPTMLHSEYYQEGGWATGMRTDKAPFSDIRVRKAMMMATDFNKIKNEYYSGEAQIVTFPIVDVPDYHAAYLPIEEASPAAQELYKYNPDKAKVLLRDAGYPNGFKTTMIISNGTDLIDYYSILKDMWSKVGIELTLDTRESAVWTSIDRGRQYEQMIHASTGGVGSLYRCVQFWGPGFTNCGFVNDPYIDPIRTQIQTLVMQGNQSGADKIYKDLMKYVYDQAWAIPYPNAMLRAFWWPWVKNYHGEYGTGYYNYNNFATWIWLDQDLKEQVTGRR